MAFYKLLTVSLRELTSESFGYMLEEQVLTELLDEKGNKVSETKSYVLIKPGLDEATLSDALIEALGIVILQAKKGVWKHVNDPPSVIRMSVS